MRVIFAAVAQRAVALLAVALLAAASLWTAPVAAAAPETPAPEGQAEPVHATPADLETVMTAVKAPGARAVLVNVWATWCEPCREEMPDLLRFYRENRARGLRLVMVSADDEEQRAVVEQVLSKAGFDGPAFIKHGDDMAFINGLEPRWSGQLPSTFLFDGDGNRKRFWAGMIGTRELKRGVGAMLAPPPGKKTPPRRKP